MTPDINIYSIQKTPYAKRFDNFIHINLGDLSYLPEFGVNIFFWLESSINYSPQAFVSYVVAEASKWNILLENVKFRTENKTLKIEGVVLTDKVRSEVQNGV